MTCFRGARKRLGKEFWPRYEPLNDNSSNNVDFTLSGLNGSLTTSQFDTSTTTKYDGEYLYICLELDITIVSQIQWKDTGGHVTYDDEEDAYVTYKPDWTFQVVFNRDKGGSELYVSPNVSEDYYESCVSINQLNAEYRLQRLSKKDADRAIRAQEWMEGWA